MQIKYRIGVMPGQWPAGPDGRDLFWRVIETCERTEIDSIWFSDRLSSPIPVLEPIIAMAAVAARTQRLKFGPSVLVAPFRAPVLAARQLAMLDYLSGGRALPAVGIGVEQEREFRAAGVPFKERGRRTDEAIRIMRRCWAEDEVTHEGEFWKLERVTVLPKPVQQPMPLWIGGNSEAAMRRAGRLGDGWIPSFITPEQFRAGVEKTCAFAAEARREVPGDHFGALVNFWLDDDPARARATAAPFVPRGRVYGLRPARASRRAAGGVRRWRRFQVHCAADGPARSDARAARAAGRRGDPTLPPPLGHRRGPRRPPPSAAVSRTGGSGSGGPGRCCLPRGPRRRARLAGPGASRRGPRRRPPRPLARRRSGRAARACERPRRSRHRSRVSRPSGARGGSGT